MGIDVDVDSRRFQHMLTIGNIDISIGDSALKRGASTSNCVFGTKSVDRLARTSICTLLVGAALRLE